MYWDVEVTPEEEDELINKIAEKIHSYGMGIPAILVLDTVKPLSRLGTTLGGTFLSPFLPIFGDEMELNINRFLQVIEKRENVEKILKKLEELSNNN